MLTHNQRQTNARAKWNGSTGTAQYGHFLELSFNLFLKQISQKLSFNEKDIEASSVFLIFPYI